MIHFACPQCEAALQVPDDHAGQKVTCPACTWLVPVPRPGIEERAADVPNARGRPWAPAWVRVGGAGLLVIAISAIVVLVIRSSSRDGLTRAERAELEVKMKHDLPGAWEQGGVESRSVYTFTPEGRFEVTRYAAGKKVGGHVGTWSVTRARMTLQVTESADDLVGTGRPFEMAITDVKSENGTVFKFSTSFVAGDGQRLTFTRQATPPKTEPSKPPSPVTEAKKDELTRDQRLARWILGKWTSSSADGTWEWDFHVPLDTSGHYSVKIQNGGREVGSFAGQWFFVAGQLTLTVQVSFYARMPTSTSHLFEVDTFGTDAFVLRTVLKEYVAELKRRK